MFMVRKKVRENTFSRSGNCHGKVDISYRILHFHRKVKEMSGNLIRQVNELQNMSRIITKQFQLFLHVSGLNN